jgi:hypothetical protein
MRFVTLILVLFVTLLLACSAYAVDFSGVELFVPIAARTPGANETRWRTDLVLSSRNETEETSVSIIYQATGGTPIQSQVTLTPRQTVTVVDILSESFNREQSYGTLWLGSSNANVKIAAHARIYNTGNAAGEFGQIVQALPIEQLGRKAWLQGLIGIRGNRTNIGVANPNNTPPASRWPGTTKTASSTARCTSSSSSPGRSYSSTTSSPRPACPTTKASPCA